MQLGAGTVLKTVQAIEAGTVPQQAQDDAQASHAPKIFHETCQINFDQNTAQVHNFVRGLSPFPAAWTTLDDLELKVLRTEKEIVEHEHPTGHLFSDGRSYLKYSTRDGYVKVLELQLQGRKRMGVRDFLNGYALKKQ